MPPCITSVKTLQTKLTFRGTNANTLATTLPVARTGKRPRWALMLFTSKRPSSVSMLSTSAFTPMSIFSKPPMVKLGTAVEPSTCPRCETSMVPGSVVAPIKLLFATVILTRTTKLTGFACFPVSNSQKLRTLLKNCPNDSGILHVHPWLSQMSPGHVEHPRALSKPHLSWAGHAEVFAEITVPGGAPHRQPRLCSCGSWHLLQPFALAIPHGSV
mmetsp:Transcript_21947/g.65429  ORF Transcript_21947/g.65429 Transcript_21947/m.65429 type:complete len:215 (+) Transcript_21947:106-750(+)